LKLTDLAPLEKWLALEQKINKRFGLNASVFDVAGVRITDFKKWANKICPVIKSNQKGKNFICSLAHQNIATQAMHTHQPVMESCDAGLMKLVVPVFIDNEFLGAVSECGCLLDNNDVDMFMIHKTIGINEEKLMGLSETIPIMTPKEATSHICFIQNEVARIVNAYEDKR
jgi:ligand-binding sensor protein